jgi:hypothetical protein
MSADSAIETIIQAAPTDWIWPPRFENRLADHTDRNTDERNGDNAETAWASVDESGSSRVTDRPVRAW